MRETFVLEDLFNAVITLEQLGYAVYTNLAERPNEENFSAIFKKLARAEKKHESLYSKMKKDHINFNSTDLDSEYYDYIRNLLDSNFALRGNILSEIKTEKDALEIALQLENETILFLKQIKLIIKNKAIDDIIDEEKKHIVEVNRMMQKISKQ